MQNEAPRQELDLFPIRRSMTSTSVHIGKCRRILSGLLEANPHAAIIVADAGKIRAGAADNSANSGTKESITIPSAAVQIETQYYPLRSRCGIPVVRPVNGLGSMAT